ncbi:MAG TPA: NPCBM/NEW2 domain-containing protein [Tepidisphaeraceae bacterium]|nr:NPCBM/NEW2 domain-containing protein [Tepidisphaeraceae bacterium]
MLTSISRADEQWILTTADFHSETIALRSIDDAGIHIPAAGGDERTVPMTQFLQLDRVSPSRSTIPRLFLLLTNGDSLGGNPSATQGESLLWHSPTLGDVSFPLKNIRAIEHLGQPTPSNQSSRTEDVLTLANGDTLHGIISDVTAANITIQPTGGDSTPVPLQSINSAEFASPPGSTSAPATPKRAFRVSMTDGTILSTDSVHLADRDLHILLPGNIDHAIPLSSIAGVEQIDGPVIWLSSCTPTQNIQIPFFSQHAEPAQMNKSVEGDSIRFGDREFSHGIGVHSYSRLDFPIDPTCKSFRTQYAIDGDQPWADVTVRIKLDGKIAFEKTHVTTGVLSDVVNLDLNGAKTLTLEVDYGENYDVQDRLNWIEPALLRK